MIRSIIKSLLFSAGLPHIQCNICGHRDRHMQSDSWHKGTVCLKCRSQVRHRLFMQCLLSPGSMDADHLLKNKNVLHFAPDEMLLPFLRSRSGKYTTADFFAEGYEYGKIDLHLDISDMHGTVEDGQYDTVIAMDVMEHVADDKKGFAGIFRILRQGGTCVITVPQADHLEITDEDPGIKSPEERLRRFGQKDHVRIYGKDIVTRMELAGFKVTAIDERDFPEKTARKHVLFPPELSDRPHATNFRKIYFGKKP